jgi:release factor glutamine methyltransferase
MKNSKALFQDFVSRIKLEESKEEIYTIAYMVFENLFKVSKTDVMSERALPCEPNEDKLEEAIFRINTHEPIQYILGEAFFFGRKFKVNSAVLIPRPETEELVQVVLDFVRSGRKRISAIVDVGTGSGCIPITLALELRSPTIKIWGTDVSEKALEVARKNATVWGVDTRFYNQDVLTDFIPVTLDVIISNPPYIPMSDRETLSKNVVDYEPSTALFVEPDDPLIFYKALVQRSRQSLKPGGMLAVEINERFGLEVSDLLESSKFVNVQIIKDMFGKDRIVTGIFYSEDGPDY